MLSPTSVELSQEVSYCLRVGGHLYIALGLTI